MLAVTAFFVPLTGNMIISGDAADNTISLDVLQTGQIQLNGTPVSSAIVGNTRSIVINAGDGNDSIQIDQTRVRFEPGLGSETGIAEIEISVNGQGGSDTLSILGTNSPDVFDIGANGINLNGDDDIDVTLSGVELVIVDGQNAGDIINGGGSPVVGPATSLPLILRGGFGLDTITGGNGNDEIDGGPQNDTLSGGRGNDRITAVLGVDTVFGNDGDDILITSSALLADGGAGNDTISSSTSNTIIRGGSGDDTIIGPGGDIDGGAGTDSYFFEPSAARQSQPNVIKAFRDSSSGKLVTELRDTFNTLFATANSVAIERLFVSGGASNDTIDLSLLGKSELFLLGISEVSAFGRAGNDTIRGSGIADFITGDEGNDTLIGLGGNDTIRGDAGNDRLFGGADHDSLFGGDGNDDLFGGDGNDQLFGEAGDDRLFGENGNDALDGGSGINFLDEGPGQGGIVINGTSGNDVILAGRQVINGVAQVVITVNGFSTIQPYVNGETIIVNAGAGNDVVILEASAWNNWQAIFHGGDGNDSLHGGLKNDQLYGEAGNDWLFGLAGDDILVGGDGNDWLYGHAGRDLMIGGNDTDRLFGGLDDDIVIGGRTAFDANAEALSALSTQWNSAGSYVTRAASITKGSGDRLKKGTTVFNDGRTDYLNGESGRDLFFADLADQFWDRSADEILI